MSRSAIRAWVFAVVVSAALTVTPCASAQFPIPRAPDSDAPAGAPPHWLPNEHWVHHHYLPFDEARLYALLRTSRDGLWKWLRDDNYTLAQLAEKKGYKDPKRLTELLVPARSMHRSGAHHAAAGHHDGQVTVKELRARTLRLLLQGHLAQHVIFHSLHQETGPSEAPRLFGVSKTRFQALRRLDLSPLQIGRRNGHSRAEMQRGLERALRATLERGVERGEISERQARTLLRRQLRQVPRWLGEEHYNGPPQTVGGKPKFPFRASFATPDLSGDGSTVMFNSAQPAPPLAVRFGEVNLAGRDLAAGADITPRDGSASATAAAPCSSFNPSISTDGRTMAYEVSAGNRTFAKRYGNVVIARADMGSRTVRRIAGGAQGRAVTTAYNPSLSGNGRVVAYTMTKADPMSPESDPATWVGIHDARTGKTTRIPVAGAYEPVVSSNGRHVAFTAFAEDGRLQVWVYDRTSRRTSQVSSAAGEAWAPSISADGRLIAYAASATPGGRSRIWVRDMRRTSATAVTPASRDFVDSPSISGDGKRVAYARQLAGTRTSALGRPLQQVMVRRVASGAPVAVSAAGAWSGQPQLSDDGLTVAFTTDDGTPPEGGPGGLRVAVHRGSLSIASPQVAATTFDGGPAALDPGAGGVCDLRSPTW